MNPRFHFHLPGDLQSLISLGRHLHLPSSQLTEGKTEGAPMIVKYMGSAGVCIGYNALSVLFDKCWLAAATRALCDDQEGPEMLHQSRLTSIHVQRNRSNVGKN